MSSIRRFVRCVLAIAVLGVCALLVVAVSMAPIGPVKQSSAVIPRPNTANLMPEPSLVALWISQATPARQAVSLTLGRVTHMSEGSHSQSLAGPQIRSGNAVNVILAKPGDDGSGGGGGGYTNGRNRQNYNNGRNQQKYDNRRNWRDYTKGGGGEDQICHRGRGHEENQRCMGGRKSTNCQDWGHKGNQGYKRDHDCYQVPPPRPQCR